MSQEQLLKIITDNPGITQKELRKYNKSSGEQVRGLLKKRLIRRKPLFVKTESGRTGQTYKLYPVIPDCVFLDKSLFCDLRTQDPGFNQGKGKVFRNAFDRAIIRGDFR